MTNFTEILLKEYLNYKEQFNEEPIDILKKIIATYGDIFYMWDDEFDHTIYVIYSHIVEKRYTDYFYLKLDYSAFKDCQTYDEILKRYLNIKDKEIRDLGMSDYDYTTGVEACQWLIVRTQSEREIFFLNCVMRLFFEYKVFYKDY